MNKKTRKLSLSRETVRDLASDHLRGVAGGVLTDTCPRPCSLGTCVSECTMCSDCCM